MWEKSTEPDITQGRSLRIFKVEEGKIEGREAVSKSEGRKN